MAHTDTESADLGADAGTREATLDPEMDPAEARQISSGAVAEIPSELLDEDDLANFLEHAIEEAEADRGDLMDNLSDWEETYQASSNEEKNWPIQQASNLTVPVAKEIANTLTSQLSQTLLTPEPTWIVEKLSKEWEPFKDLVEAFMHLAADRELDFDDVIEEWILEAVKFGTSIVEVGHDYQEKRQYIIGDDGERTKKTRVVQEGPTLYNVPIDKFIIPFNEDSVQDAKWCGKIFRMTEHKLKERAQSGHFREEAVARLIQLTPEDEDTELEDTRKSLRDLEATNRKHRLYEIWMSYNLDDGDDIETEIRVWYHKRTRTFLSTTFNPFWHGERPFAKMEFFPVEHQFYGEGVCQQLQDIQQEISTIHNQRIDNATLANFRMIVVNRMSASLGPGDPLYSGKIIEAEDPGSDVVPFQLSEVYPSTVENEAVTRRYAERVTGVSEAQSVGGKPQSRTTATAQMALLQEGAKRFDQAVRKGRAGIGRIGNLVLSIYFQFGAGDKPVMWLGEKGKILKALFRLPSDASQIGIGLKASAPTSKLNKEQQRQNSLALFNLMVQLYERILQLTGQLAPQQVAVVANSLVSSAKKFMDQVLESFDVKDPEEVLAGLTVLERVLPAPEDLGGLEDFREGERTDQILNQLGQLEAVLEGTTESEGRDGSVGRTGRQLRRFLETQRRAGSDGSGLETSSEPFSGTEEVGGRAFPGAGG